jgi:hypothetical protein
MSFMLWIDGVGGYWVCLADSVVLGQPGPAGGADVPILGDLARRHARVRRDAEGYSIEPLRDVRLDARPLTGPAALTDGARIDLGAKVRLVFRRPHGLSASARLEFASAHRTHPPADGVLLMADALVLGPNRHSHVVCRAWPREVVLYRAGERLFCRSSGPIEIDGAECRDRGPVTRHSRISGEGFSFSLEAMDLTRSSPAFGPPGSSEDATC